MRAKLANPALGERRRILAGDAHQAILARVGQRPQQNGIDKGVDDRICADAESQRQHRGDREPRRSAHLPHGKADVLQKAFDRRQRRAISKCLPGLLGAAQPQHSLAMRFFPAEAGTHRIVSIHRDVAFQLGIEFDGLPAHEDAAQSQPQCSLLFS